MLSEAKDQCSGASLVCPTDCLLQMPRCTQHDMSATGSWL